ncbi:MAG: 50S ribosomal protein L3 [Nitriliruptoraceae bacterium]|jgi:large subunit ribosomal protein L3
MGTRGILGTKLGMTQVFDDEGRIIPVTVVHASPNTVTQVKRVETDGYTAVQLAFGARKHVTRPMAGHLAKAGVASARSLAEVRLDSEDDLPEQGATVGVTTFGRGEMVDVIGTSRGKGYAGVMKRHNFSGMGDGHGVKKKNRHPGSVGACSTPGRTFRGTRMAGRMGGERVTIQNLEVVDVDAENDLILIRGAVPGADGSVVMVRAAVKARSAATQGGDA